MHVLEYKSRVAEVGCVLCHHLGLGHTQPTLHHVRDGQGLSQRASDWLVVPLCSEHHLGASGFHGLGQSGFYTRYKLSELHLLAMTIQRVMEL